MENLNKHDYTSMNSSLKMMYDESLELVSTIDKTKLKFINKKIALTSNDTLENMIFLRKLLKIPSFLSDDQIDGNEYSFLTIQNKTIIGKYFVRIYFVLSEFDDVMFTNCEFNYSIFIGAKGNIKFTNCVFNQTYFNYASEFTFESCKYDKVSYGSIEIKIIEK